MSLTGGAAIQAALLQLGVYDPGETPSTSEQNNCLLIINEMLASWFNEQAQALTVLLAEQNKSGNAYIAEQVRVTSPLFTAYPLAGGTYTAPSYTAGSYSPGSAPNFPDLTTAQTFPEGYELAIVLNSAVILAAQYPGVGAASPTLVKAAMDALAAAAPAPGRIPVIGAGIQGVLPPPTPAQQPGPQGA
jgi:hypothetical protein